MFPHDAPIRIAIYCRVSTRDKGQDPENQFKQLREFAKAQGWQIVREFIDQASAKNSDRIEFKKMLEAASRHEFDLILFWSLDRFSREGALATLQHLQRLTDYGVGFRSFTEAYLDSCGMFREAVISILAVIAKQERLRLSERTLAGIRRYREDFEQGKIGRSKQSKSGKNLPIGRPKVIFDRQKVQELRKNGLSLRQIACTLGVGLGTVHRTLDGVPKFGGKPSVKGP